MFLCIDFNTTFNLSTILVKLHPVRHKKTHIQDSKVPNMCLCVLFVLKLFLEACLSEIVFSFVSFVVKINSISILEELWLLMNLQITNSVRQRQGSQGERLNGCLSLYEDVNSRVTSNIYCFCKRRMSLL